MKLYRSLNMIFLIIFIIGTVLCFKYLPSEIPLFMQSPSRWVFVGICFAAAADGKGNRLCMVRFFHKMPRRPPGSSCNISGNLV